MEYDVNVFMPLFIYQMSLCAQEISLVASQQYAHTTDCYLELYCVIAHADSIKGNSDIYASLLAVHASKTRHKIILEVE